MCFTGGMSIVASFLAKTRQVGSIPTLLSFSMLNTNMVETGMSIERRLKYVIGSRDPVNGTPIVQAAAIRL